MKRSWIFIILALFVVGGIWLLSATRAASKGLRGKLHPSMMANRDFRGGMGWCGFQPTDEEKEKIRNIMMGTHQQGLLLNLEEQRKKIDLAEILLNPNPTKSELDKKLDEILAIQKEKQEHLIDSYFRIKQALKPEDRDAFTCMIVQHLTSGPTMPGGPGMP